MKRLTSVKAQIRKLRKLQTVAVAEKLHLELAEERAQHAACRELLASSEADNARLESEMETAHTAIAALRKKVNSVKTNKDEK